MTLVCGVIMKNTVKIGFKHVGIVGMDYTVEGKSCRGTGKTGRQVIAVPAGILAELECISCQIPLKKDYVVLCF
jgi:hypothetical protein